MAAREEKCVSLIKLLLKSILKTKMIYHSTRCQEHNCQGVAEVLTGERYCLQIRRPYTLLN